MKINVGALRLMVIDDQKTMRSIIRRLLEQIGITNVAEAKSGSDALGQLQGLGRNGPQVIICDLYMDGIDGIQFVQTVRAGKAGINPKTPILILTGEGDKMVHEVTEQVGATGVLQKPISAADMRSEIENAVMNTSYG